MVKDVMMEKHGPKGHMSRHKARELFKNIYRKFREEIKDYLERYDKAKRYWVKVDPEYKQPEELYAKQIIWNSGLTREETNKLFKKSWRLFKDKDRYEEQIIRDQLIEMHAHIKDMDTMRVSLSQKNNGRHHFPSKLHTLYVEHKPLMNQIGTDLTLDYVYVHSHAQPYISDNGFDPLNSVLIVDDEYADMILITEVGVSYADVT